MHNQMIICSPAAKSWIRLSLAGAAPYRDVLPGVLRGLTTGTRNLRWALSSDKMPCTISEQTRGLAIMTRHQTIENQRLEESQQRKKPWKRWGPYLAERQWGTVREDYSPDGAAWE